MKEADDMFLGLNKVFTSGSVCSTNDAYILWPNVPGGEQL